MSTTAKIEGSCLCGSVSITVDGPHDPRPGACHCRMCQRWSGGIFLCFKADVSAVTVTGDVSIYASSSFSERAFCPKCGSHLWMKDVKGESYDLMPGLFDAVLDQPMRSEIYVDQAMAAARFASDHPKSTRAQYEAQHKFVKGDAR